MPKNTTRSMLLCQANKKDKLEAAHLQTVLKLFLCTIDSFCLLKYLIGTQLVPHQAVSVRKGLCSPSSLFGPDPAVCSPYR